MKRHLKSLCGRGALRHQDDRLSSSKSILERANHKPTRKDEALWQGDNTRYSMLRHRYLLTFEVLSGENGA